MLPPEGTGPFLMGSCFVYQGIKAAEALANLHLATKQHDATVNALLELKKLTDKELKKDCPNYEGLAKIDARRTNLGLLLEKEQLAVGTAAKAVLKFKSVLSAAGCRVLGLIPGL